MLEKVEKIERAGQGGRPAPINSPDIKGTLTVTEDRYTGSFSLPSEGISETFTGSYKLTPSTRKGVFGYSPPLGSILKGMIGFVFEDKTVTVVYNISSEPPFTQYVLSYTRS
jgi:hypothetical protein